ncbi:MAG: hypothetical protein JF618_09415, partial [Leifsonia sp.]|nr:hypothetical protein [Leifsonia sp.]
TLEHTGRNQDGVVVATATRQVMVWCRDASPVGTVDDPAADADALDQGASAPDGIL